LELLEHAPLGPRTTLGVGGNARYLVEAGNEQQVLEALEWARGRGAPVRVLGGGSNLVVSDDGFDGLVLVVALRGLAFSSASGDAVLEARAGERWDDVVQSAVARGLAGLEGLSGIPGCAGATPIQNVGAYGQEVAETISRVRAVDRSSLQIVELSRADCRFAYRDSFFNHERRFRADRARPGTGALSRFAARARAARAHSADAGGAARLRAQCAP
jgi:UDP-N-acetylmuramate dehydrogenase